MSRRNVFQGGIGLLASLDAGGTTGFFRAPQIDFYSERLRDVTQERGAEDGRT
jgi:hypothetical protein